MFEIATDERTRRAFDAAHKARANAVSDFWSWLTGPRTSG